MVVAAGNIIVLKPSELASNIIFEIIKNVFNNQHVISIQGDIEIFTELLEQR